MEAAELTEIIKNSHLTTSEVLQRIYELGHLPKDEFPNAYDKNGKIRIKFDTKKTYKTFCPFHDDQKNGDSFFISNEEQTGYCFNGSCGFTGKPISLITFVMATVLKLDHSIAMDFELSQQHFWKAARFLVKEFSTDIGVTLDDISPKTKFKPKATDKILQDTMEYYHFLGTKNKVYAGKLTVFLEEVRHLHKGTMKTSEIVEEYKLGITPYSDTNDRLYKYLKTKKYSDEEILESRVCIVAKDGKIKDFFINRAIIPYFFKNKVIGMYGRDMNPNGNKKYRHMRLEGEVRVPNGLDDILGEEHFFLSEGEFSKIAIATLGYKNVMEARGTNGFKTSHAEIIQKVRKNNPDKVKRCYLVFDPDVAGADSVFKIGKRLIDVGVEVLVVRLPTFYEGEKVTYVDPNDLLEIYGEDAKAEFDKMVEEAISYDAFMLLHNLEKNRPDTLSSARMAFKNQSAYLDSIPRIERIFILEEVLEHLDTKVDKDILREYLKEYWLSSEAKRPLEGLNEAISADSPFLILTKNETFYEESKESLPNLVLIRNENAFFDRKIDKNVLLDSSFGKEDAKNFNGLDVKIARCNLTPNEDEPGKYRILLAK